MAIGEVGVRHSSAVRAFIRLYQTEIIDSIKRFFVHDDFRLSLSLSVYALLPPLVESTPDVRIILYFFLAVRRYALVVVSCIVANL